MNIGIVAQISVEQCAHCRVSVPADTAVELDARFGQSCLRTAADASADQSVHAVLHQEACQCAVTAAIGVNDFRMSDFAVRSFIKLELFSVAEKMCIRDSFMYCVSFRRTQKRRALLRQCLHIDTKVSPFQSAAEPNGPY